MEIKEHSSFHETGTDFAGIKWKATKLSINLTRYLFKGAKYRTDKQDLAQETKDCKSLTEGWNYIYIYILI